MTDISDTLAALSEPVAWMYERDDGSIDLLLDCNGEQARCLLELGATETPLYRTGQLVPVPSVDDLAEVISEHFDFASTPRLIATAVIAAMQEGRDG